MSNPQSVDSSFPTPVYRFSGSISAPLTLKSLTSEVNRVSSLDSITTSDAFPVEVDSNQVPLGHKYISIVCDNCGHSVRIPLFCKDKTCIFCRKRLYGHTIARYKQIMTGNRSLRFMTLTIPNLPDITTAAIDLIRYYWKRLYSLKAIKSRIKGGLYVIEVTNTGKGWHIHMHLIIEGDYIPQAFISNQWKRITGTARIVYISKVKNHFMCFRYISGYLLKSPLVGNLGSILSSVLKSIRIINSFGSWYRIKRPKGVVRCPVCGNIHWISAYALGTSLDMDAWTDAVNDIGPPKSVAKPFAHQMSFCFINPN